MDRADCMLCSQILYPNEKGGHKTSLRVQEGNEAGCGDCQGSEGVGGQKNLSACTLTFTCQLFTPSHRLLPGHEEGQMMLEEPTTDSSTDKSPAGR